MIASPPRELICNVPGCESGAAPLAVSALAGGRNTNRVWRVATPRGEFVLRVRHGPLDRPGSAASFELSSHQLAAAAGLAPPIQAAAADGRWMVMEFVAAPPWSESQLLSNAGIDALGSVLRRVHDLACPGLPQVDVALVAQDYCNAIAQCLPGSAAKAAAELAAIQRDTREIASLSQRAVLNHGDLMASNLLGDPPMLVDWEYAQRTDPTWDVACLLAYYPSLESRLDRLLAACELATRDDRQILSLQQRQFTRLNCLWQKLQVRN